MAEPRRIPTQVELPDPPKRPEDVVSWATRHTAMLLQVLRRIVGSHLVTMENVADGQLLQRSGSTVISGGVPGAGAPTDAEYVVAAAHAGLSAERVATDTPTVDADMTVAAQAKWHAVGLRVTGPVDLVAGVVTDGEFLKRVGATIVSAVPAGGSGNFGTAVVDFGAFPGKSDASVAVTGQAGIVGGSKVNAWLRLEATADHSADEHWIEALRLFAGNIVAGTGFTVYARNDSEINEPLFPSRAEPAVSVAAAAITTDERGEVGLSPLAGIGGMGTRIYGQWNVQWQWA